MVKKKTSKKKFRCGMVSIVGRPNVGKSTLLNTIVGEKVAIVSSVPQTTRNQVRGIYNDQNGQIIFMDTPGLHSSRDKLDEFMNSSALRTTRDADCIIHLVDTKEPVGRDEEEIVRRLMSLNIPVVLGLNKVDVKGKFISDYIELWEETTGKTASRIKNFSIVPVSGQTDINIDTLIKVLFEYLPEGEALYPQDTVTDTPQRMVIADIIREKLLNSLRDEIPHSIAVIIENVAPRTSKTLHIQALVLVSTDSQKRIVIGKNGEVLKTIGTQARVELEALLETKIFLEIFVKPKKKWRDNSSVLEEMGYVSF